MLKTISMIVVGASISLGAVLQSHSLSTDSRLSSSDLASIRGASPPGCVQSGVLHSCTHPAGPSFDSTCRNCFSVSDQVRATSATYPVPGACATTGTGYMNNWFRTCSMSGPSNESICSTGIMDCTWPVSCVSGAVVNDMQCDASWMCTVSAPPQDFVGFDGKDWQQRYACRDCSTGAPSAVGVFRVNTGSCVPASQPE